MESGSSSGAVSSRRFVRTQDTGWGIVHSLAGPISCSTIVAWPASSWATRPALVSAHLLEFGAHKDPTGSGNAHHSCTFAFSLSCSIHDLRTTIQYLNYDLAEIQQAAENVGFGLSG